MASKTKATSVEISLGYFKVGDDWSHVLEQNKGNVPKALCQWEAMLRACADGLARLAKAVESDTKATGDGGAHMAWINTRLAEDLLKKKGLPIQRPFSEDDDLV